MLGSLRRLTLTPRYCSVVRNFAQPSLKSAENKRFQNTNNENEEKQYLFYVKNDPDVFGIRPHKVEKIDEDDLREDKFLEDKPFGRKLRIKQYANIIQDLLRKRKIKEAIDVLEIRMIIEDRVKPNNYIYNLLIGACGRVGYTKKAFSLFNNMKKRALPVHPSTYTSLFNACANSPWVTTDGLTRARELRELIVEKHYEPNISNYHAMIKAFGRAGDLPTAFSIVDEMISKKVRIKAETLNFLLQACITDTEVGFRHILLVWRKFFKYRIAPNIFSYNLLLRATRDCGMGDVEMIGDVINQLLGEERMQVLESSEGKVATTNPQKLLPVTIEEPDESSTCEEVAMVPIEVNSLNRPNLLASVPHLGNILSLSEVKTPQDRLLLIGGFQGLLKNMEENKCIPDVKTLSLLLESIPNTEVVEREILLVAKKNKVELDVDFYNILIRKKSMRSDYEGAKGVLRLIKKQNKRPNLLTYGVLSLGCKTKEDAENLIDEMNSHNYRINVEILGAMMKQACFHNEFAYVSYLMDLCKEQNIKASPKLLEILLYFKRKCRKMTNDKMDKLGQSPAFQKKFRTVRLKYEAWLKEVELENNEDIHPWQQYRQDTETDVRHYKDKEQSSRFKPIHLSKFKVRTSTKKRW